MLSARRSTARAPLEFAPLDARDARALAQLVAALPRRAAAARDGEGGFAALLADAQNASLALRDGGRLVGALLARVERPAGSGALVRVLQVWLLPSWRRHLHELLARACDRALAGDPLGAVEVDVPRAQLERWRRVWSARARRLGWQHAGETPAADAAGAAHVRVRWERDAARAADPRSLPLWRTLQADGATWQIRVARSELEWARLESAWDALVISTPETTSFQSYAYLRVWWQQFGAHRRLWILACWRDAELVGIAPLQLTCTRELSGAVQQLSFVGASVPGDRFNCGNAHRPRLLFGARSAEGARLLQDALARADAPWDRVDLYGQSPEGALVSALREGARAHGQLVRSEPVTDIPYVTIDRPYAEYFAGLRGRLRTTVRTSRRRLEEIGTLAREHHVSASALGPALEQYLELESRSWKTGGEAAVGAPGRREFYRALCAALGDKGSLEISALTCGGRWIAARIHLLHGRRCEMLEATHDAALDAHSPGTLLAALVLEDAFASGCAVYDFGSGYLAHKLRWTRDVHVGVRLYLDRPTLANRLLYTWLLQLRPALRHALERSGLLQRALALHAAASRQLQRWLNPHSGDA